MPQKNRREKKSAAKAQAKEAGPRPDPTAAALAVRKRRNRRLIVLGSIALLIPALELVAYRFRAITVTVANRTKEPVTGLKFSYTGGDFSQPEIRPGGSITRVIRPDFSFRRDAFSTYRTTIEFATPEAHHRDLRRVATLDYSSFETYEIQPGPDSGRVEVKQKTSPGFPLSAVRDLLARLGIG